jgi:protein-S-isoprenylcysteine O-methyltransferase Ste14
MTLLDDSGQFILYCYAFFLVYLIAMAVYGKMMAAKGNVDPRWRFLILVIALIALTGLPEVRVHRLGAGGTFFPLTPAVAIAADILTLCGVVIAVWARRTLAVNWSLHPTIREHHELITNGPYAYVRHPMYSGTLLMFLGLAVYMGNAAGFITLAIIFIVISLFRIRPEEELLAGRFGEKWEEYKRKTKRLVPGVF